MTAAARFPALEVPLATLPMEARTAEVLPNGAGWRFEPKWDGFRCLAFRSGAQVALRSKSGKPLERYFPDVAARLAAVPVDRFVVDGELAILVDGRMSFDALQLRLHPAASRVARLADEQPAGLILFDCLASADGASLMEAPLARRRETLLSVWAGFDHPPGLSLSPGTEDRAEAQAWLAGAGGDIDGVVAKRLDRAYRPGEREMVKVKRLRTADCVIGGFRYGTGSKAVGSLLLGLYDADGRLDHVGFTSAIPAAERAALTRRLEALAPGPGFTGKAPGGPSRWSTERSGEYVALRHELVVEVGYDHVSGGRFRHGTSFLRWRPDKAPGQCRRDQIGG